MESLAVKYRPKTWDEVVEADAIKQILNEQVKTNQLKRVLLFTGPAGTGKTTNARIFAKEIETSKANIIELNAADKTGVDDMRVIIDNAKTKPLQGRYKIFIIDECHSLTTQAQNSLLKILEEPPVYCIFILCTTDPQKILSTILSRAYRYDFQKISFNGIVNRLKFILQSEKNSTEGCGIQSWSDDALNYIAKISNGGMRDAITLLDKCISYSKDLKIEDVIAVLGVTSYDKMFSIFDALIKKDEVSLTTELDSLYKSGKDLKLFVKNLLSFTLDVNKFILFHNFDLVSIPNIYEHQLYYNQSHKPAIKKLLQTLISLNATIKWESDPKTLLESTLLLEVL